MRIFLLALTCMTFFAANSILCRAALRQWGMDPWSYTAWRGFSAVLSLLGLAWFHFKDHGFKHNFFKTILTHGSFSASLALFSYMVCFSLAYISLPAALGTLIFNATIQFTVMGWGLYKGARLNASQKMGFILVLLGLMFLTLPQIDSSPSLRGSLLGIGVGVSWGIYSLLGMRNKDAVLATAGNFFWALPGFLLAQIIALAIANQASLIAHLLAILAGMICTGCGYILWYLLLPHMSLVNSTVIQLTVPIITALLGILFLGEAITLHLFLCSICILGGIALVILKGS